MAHLLRNIVIQEMLEQKQLKKKPTVSGGGGGGGEQWQKIMVERVKKAVVGFMCEDSDCVDGV